jgi:hypothetical protein
MKTKYRQDYNTKTNISQIHLINRETVKGIHFLPSIQVFINKMIQVLKVSLKRIKMPLSLSSGREQLPPLLEATDVQGRPRYCRHC